VKIVFAGIPFLTVFSWEPTISIYLENKLLKKDTSRRNRCNIIGSPNFPGNNFRDKVPSGNILAGNLFLTVIARGT
jgi:hypothetical protein